MATDRIGLHSVLSPLLIFSSNGPYHTAFLHMTVDFHVFLFTVSICLSLIHFIQLFTELVSLPLNHWASSKLITFVFVPRISGRGVFRTKSLCWHSGEGNCTTQTQSMATVVQRSSFLRGKMNLLLCCLRFCRLWIVFMLLIYIFLEENILKCNCTITCESNKLRLRWIFRSNWVRPPMYMY